MQDNMIGNILIGDIAPEFSANTTLGTVKLSDYKGKWLILFSYVKNFSPVCYTELISFARFNSEFLRRNTYLLGLSNDSIASTLAWNYNIYRSSGIQISFPIISDTNMDISKKYGMLSANLSTLTRSVYIIDPDQRVQVIMHYPDNIGRNISEILRLIDALQTSKKDNVLAPANWILNQPLIKNSPKTYDELVDSFKNSDGNYVDWYLCYCQPIQNFPKLDNIDNINNTNNVNNINNIPTNDNTYLNFNNTFRNLDKNNMNIKKY